MELEATADDMGKCITCKYYAHGKESTYCSITRPVKKAYKKQVDCNNSCKKWDSGFHSSRVESLKRMLNDLSPFNTNKDKLN